MASAALPVKKALLQNCLNWFQGTFRQNLVSVVEPQFPGYPLPPEIGSVLHGLEQISRLVETIPTDEVGETNIADFFEKTLAGIAGHPPLFKEMLLRYRRHWAAVTEGYREKTFHPGLTQTLDEAINSLDAVVEAPWFQEIEAVRLPRALDFLPIQYTEQSAIAQIELPPRQFDEKFHILQAPTLFLPDLAFFRAKCEVRDTSVAVAFLDIDDFKRFNTHHGHAKVDRNLLPRFMQTLEAHVYHHGFAYRQGGDEYLVLLPSLSRALAIAFLDELRQKLAALEYPEIDDTTTVSLGMCLVEPDCPLTDRELLGRASQANAHAKAEGKNRIVTYEGSRLLKEDLRVVRPA